MKTLLNPWFIAGCMVWILIQSTRRLGYPLPYANSYMADLAAVPVIANLGLWFQRVWIIKSNYYVLAPWHVIFIVVYASIWFEVLLPNLSAKYTADWVDVTMYVAGGLLFYRFMNKPLVTDYAKR